MKRSLFKLALFLVLGAIVNVAVAQGFALTQERHWTHWSEIELTPWQVQWWVDHAPDGFVPVPQESSDIRPVRFGISATLMDANNVNWDNVALRRAGWPLRAIEGAQWLRLESGSGLRYVFDAMLPIGDGNRWILLRPLWFGFTANTLLYAFLLYGLFFGPRIVRRMIRRRRGHFIKCGYDLRGDFSAGCPECGWRREGSDEPKG